MEKIEKIERINSLQDKNYTFWEQENISKTLNLWDIDELDISDFLCYLWTLDWKYNIELLNHIDKRFYSLIKKFDHIYDYSNAKIYKCSYIEFEELKNFVELLKKIWIHNSIYDEKLKEIDDLLFLIYKLWNSFNEFISLPRNYSYNNIVDIIKEWTDKWIEFFDIRFICIKSKNKIVDIIKDKNALNNFSEEYIVFLEKIDFLLNNQNTWSYEYDIRNYIDTIHYIWVKWALNSYYEWGGYTNFWPYIWQNSKLMIDKLRGKELDKKLFDIDILDKLLLHVKKRIFTEIVKSSLETVIVSPSYFNINSFLSNIDDKQNLLDESDSEYEELINKQIIIVLDKFRAMIPLITYYNIFKKYTTNLVNDDDFLDLLKIFKNNFETSYHWFPDIDTFINENLSIKDILAKFENWSIKYPDTKELKIIIDITFEVIRKRDNQKSLNDYLKLNEEIIRLKEEMNIK